MWQSTDRNVKVKKNTSVCGCVCVSEHVPLCRYVKLYSLQIIIITIIIVIIGLLVALNKTFEDILIILGNLIKTFQ